MGYVNNYGQSIGPIKIENVWAGTIKRSNKIFLAFARNTATLQGNAGEYAPLLAETPSQNEAIGEAVVTVEWATKYVENQLQSLRKQIEELENRILELQQAGVNE